MVNSLGAITANSITEYGSEESTGAVFYNSYNTAAPQPIALTGTNIFNNNFIYGLEVFSYGSITLNNVTANDNQNDGGAYVANDGGTTPAKVTLTGINTFNKNNTKGLEIHSLGAVSLTRITSENNSNDGVYIHTNGTISLTCGRFISNTGTGVNLSSPTTMTLIGVTSINNRTGNNSTDYSFTGGGTHHSVYSCPLP
jgi:hypothetical protein